MHYKDFIHYVYIMKIYIFHLWIYIILHKLYILNKYNINIYMYINMYIYIYLYYI